MQNGRIAVPSEGIGGLEGKRSGHFGHCDAFTVVDVENGEISNVTIVPNQDHQQGGCMVPVFALSDLNVDAIIVGGIGPRPLMGFNEVGIDVYHEAMCSEIRPVVESLIAGDLSVISIDQTCGGGSGGCQH